MTRPTRFEHSRYLGDKRTQIVYDLDDAATPKHVIDDIVATGNGATFGPDNLAEARNRNYRIWKGSISRGRASRVMRRSSR